MEKVSHLCIGEKVCIQWSRLLLLLFWKRAVEFEWVYLENEHANKGPFHTYSKSRNCHIYALRYHPQIYMVKSGLPVVFLILT